MRHVVFPRLGLSEGVPETIITVTRYGILTSGALTAISTLGFDLSSLAIVGGGLSVGIGFGLQDVVANFVSGILVLFEQTLRPGDIIEIGGKIGVVESLRPRSTMIRTHDNVEIIVPNKSLLTSTVTTLTHRNRIVRALLPVGVGYNSEPKVVRDALLAVAGRHGLVLDQPAPTVFFKGFGDSAINFELAIWIDGPMRMPRIMSDLHFMIWESFAERDIEIPFPQRDLHIRSGGPWDSPLDDNWQLPEDLRGLNVTQEADV